MKALKEMLGSKKFIAMIAAVIVVIAGKFGLDLSTTNVLLIVGPIMAYIGSVGMADFGKAGPVGSDSSGLFTIEKIDPEAPDE